MNLDSELTFQDLTEKIIREHIRSLLLIDDEWPSLSEVTEVDDIDESELVSKSDIEDIDIEDEPMRSPGDDKTKSADESANNNGASATSSSNKKMGFSNIPKKLSALINGDASLLEFEKSVKKEGVLFSGLAYRKKEHHDIVVDLANRADIVVLDWELASDEGNEAVSILKRLVGKGLRFICVFTQKERLHEIKKHIIVSLDENKTDQNEKDSDDLASNIALGFKYQNLVIVIRKKVSTEDDKNLDYAVEPVQLLDHAIKALAVVYNGFIQLIMLEMANIYRQYLPNVLDHFGSNLDPAFLAEVTDLDSPINSGDSFTGILLDEFRAHFNEKKSLLFDKNRINAYSKTLITNIDKLNEELIINRLIKCFRAKKSLAKKIATWACKDNFDALKKWLESGCPDVPVVKDSDERKHKKNQRAAKWTLISILSNPENQDTEFGFEELLKLDVLFHQRSEIPKHLTQGMIVKKDDDTYYICVTPLCDAERPEERINCVFSFLSAEPVERVRLVNADQIDPYIVINEDGKPLILKINVKPYFSFSIKNHFISTDKILIAYPLLLQKRSEIQENLEIPLFPIAQLRLSHAFALASAAGANATSIGVDRAEFIRHRLS